MKSLMRSLAIIGGGAAGVATFIAAVRHHAAHVIYIIDPLPIGPGTVFSNSDEDVLCNTAVELMSIVEGHPLDFYFYLKNNGHDVTPKSLVPRRWVGHYLAERFRDYCVIAHQENILVTHLPYLFVSLRIDAHRRYSIMFGDVLKPKILAITDIVFCTGYGHSLIPDIFKPYLNHPTLISSPFPEKTMLTRIPKKSSVLVIGSKLSAIDAAKLLCREGHSVTMLSMSGEIPAVRTRFMRNDNIILNQDRLESIMALSAQHDEKSMAISLKRTYLKYFINLINKNTDISFKEQFSFANNYRDRLCDEISITEKGHSQWQKIAFNFVIMANDMCLSDGLHRYFTHPDIISVIYRYITAISPYNANRLLGYMDRDILVLDKGRVQKISPPGINSERWQVNYGNDDKDFDAIVIAAGYHYPCYYFDKNSDIKVDTDGGHRKEAIDIMPSLGIKHPSLKKDESIWFVGVPAHMRFFTANILLVALTSANKIIERLMKLPKI
ncbi:Uncharacterized protein conserved in bacteria [Yersinia massiliensis]|nr:Uncharacterized protein conserved in bacteria [Yersinia massiliensis]